jgi:predicted small metal-binding protein
MFVKASIACASEKTGPAHSDINSGCRYQHKADDDHSVLRRNRYREAAAQILIKKIKTHAEKRHRENNAGPVRETADAR